MKIYAPLLSAFLITTNISFISPEPKLDSFLYTPNVQNASNASFFDTEDDLCELVDLGFIYLENGSNRKNSAEEPIVLVSQKFRRSTDASAETSRRNKKADKVSWKIRASSTDKKSNHYLYNDIEVKTTKHYTSIKSLSGLKQSLLSSLADYEGPTFQITSAKRSNDSHSHHYTGRAIDIHYNECFLNYLLTDNGSKWLEDHDLQFFIEDNYRSFIDELPSKYRKHARYIRHASNLHIHLELK